MQSDDERFSEESRKFLLEAKKGKARKFVLVREGVQIDRIVIFKVGTFDRAVRKARQDGAWGEMYYGMVQGDGTDLRFELSRADGFANPPTTDVRLKEFLRDAAGLKFEPTFVLVEQLDNAEVPEGEAGGEQAEDEGGGSESTKSGGADGGASVVEADLEEKFVRILKSILPHVKRALATATSLSDQLQQSVREAQDLGRARDFERGMTALKKVGELTKQSLAEAESPAMAADASDSATPASAAASTRRQQWDARLAEIQPSFSAAVAGDSANADKLKKVMWYSRNEARQQRFVKALVGLDRLKRFLKNP